MNDEKNSRADTPRMRKRMREREREREGERERERERGRTSKKVLFCSYN